MNYQITDYHGKSPEELEDVIRTTMNYRDSLNGFLLELNVLRDRYIASRARAEALEAFETQHGPIAPPTQEITVESVVGASQADKPAGFLGKLFGSK